MLVLLAAAASIVPSPAGAGHDMVIVHQAPAAALDGDDLVVTAGLISRCAPSVVWDRTCAPASMTVRYVQPQGRIASIGMAARFDGPAQILSAVVPGDAVKAPAFSYWLEAAQRSCTRSVSGRWRCHSASARAPNSIGMYSVTVVRR